MGVRSASLDIQLTKIHSSGLLPQGFLGEGTSHMHLSLIHCMKQGRCRLETQ